MILLAKMLGVYIDNLHKGVDRVVKVYVKKGRGECLFCRLCYNQCP